MRYPFLHEKQIRRAAEELLFDAFGHPGDVPLPVDLDVVVFDHLYEQEHLDFSDEVDLPVSASSEVIGQIFLIGGRIEIARGLKEVHLGRYRFTVAHELGHWVLHRPLWLAQQRELDLFSDGEQEAGLVTHSRDVFPEPGYRPAREEWQANQFASFLLMPPERLADEYARRFGKTPRVVADAPGAPALLRAAARDVATAKVDSRESLYEVFGVSIEAMAIALESRSYVTDEPNLFA